MEGTVLDMVSTHTQPPFFLIVRTTLGFLGPQQQIRKAVEDAGSAFFFEPVQGTAAMGAAVRRALAAGRERFVVVGDDLAVSEAANALLASGSTEGRSLGVAPTGPTDTIAATLGIATLEAGVAAALAGHTRVLDAGKATWGEPEQSAYFVIAAAAGWDPPDRADVPPVLRKLPYEVGTAALAASRLVRSPGRTFTLSVDGNEHDGRYAAVSIHNTARWRDELLVAPGASPDDALLDVLQWKDRRRFGLLTGFLRQVRNRNRPAGGIAERCPGRLVELSSPRATALVLDGKPVGTLPARIEVVPRALSFLAPAE